MAWIELHQTLPTNRKTMKLKRALRITTAQAVGHVCMLWLWALDNAVDGDLSELSADEIAEVAGWDEESADKFLEALLSSGFLDGDMRIHDWGEFSGRLIEQRSIQREQSRIRQQRRREKIQEQDAQAERDNSVSNASVTRDNSVTNEGVTCDNSVSHAEVTRSQYSTLQYSTEPKDNIDDEEDRARAREGETDWTAAFREMDIAAKEKEPLVLQYFKVLFSRPPNGQELHDITRMFANSTPELLYEAMERAAANGASSPLRYIRAIWAEWEQLGIDTLQKLAEHDERREAMRA